MARHKEPLDGGLVTIRDAALLKPGQLSSMQNATYLPGTNALHRSEGRTSFGSLITVSATAVDGLRDLKYDNGTHLLVGLASSTYYYATVGTTGSFVSAVSGVGAGSQLEVVQYRNRHFLFNGVSPAGGTTSINSNKVFYLTATGTSTPTVRQHGMLPVSSPPVMSSTADTFALTVTGYYDYWVTEVAVFTQDNAEVQLESTFVGTPASAFVDATTTVPIVIFPDIQNPGFTTHWNVYRSIKKETATQAVFPAGFLISSPISTAAGSAWDTLTVLSASASAGSVNTGSVLADFTSASNMTAADGNFSTAASTGLTDIKSQGLYNYNIGITGSVRGIVVEVKAKLSSAGTAGLGVELCRRRQPDGDSAPSLSSWGGNKFKGGFQKAYNASKSVRITGTTPTVYTLGASDDRWFTDNQVPLKDSDFNPSDFMVVLHFGDINVSTISVDYVKVTVYYGASINSVEVFPTVIYTLGDITSQVGKNGPPPSSSTGDVFNDALVVNDVDNPALIKYSYPEATEYFPPTYYVDFETRENDQVTLIKTVNGRLVVALDTSVWRMNYLPNEFDASFDRGKSKEPISEQYGCVNPMCAAVFSVEGGPQQLAFVSHKGLHTTDGYTFHTRSGQLNWRGLIPLTGGTPICLINDAENQRLQFFYQNTSNGNETYLRMDFSYVDVDEEGNFKASGPTNMRNYDSSSGKFASLESAWAVPRTNGDTSIYYGYGDAEGGGVSATAAGAGAVYIENGTVIPAEDDSWKYSTRDMYLAGEGEEWRANELYFFTGSYTSGSTPAFTFTPKTTKTNDTSGRVTKGSKSKTLGGERLSKVVFNQMAEGLMIDMQATASAAQMEYLLIDGEGFGPEDSGL